MSNIAKALFNFNIRDFFMITVLNKFCIKNKSNMCSIVAFGNPLLDIIVYVDNKHLLMKYNINADDQKELPQKEMENLYKDIESCTKMMSPGGCAQNTLRVMQWILDEPKSTVFFGTIGNDDQGEILKNLVAKNGVETRYQINERYNTGLVIGLIKGDTRALIANIGAANHFDCKKLAKDLEAIQILRNSKLVYIEACFLPNRLETVAFLEKFCLENDKVLVFNLNASYLFDLAPMAIKNLSGKCHILLGNYCEFQQLCKLYDSSDPQTLALNLNKTFENPNKNDPLLKFGKIIVITDGPGPIKCVYGSQKVLDQKVRPIAPEKMVDTVSAGDAFLAGFLSALLKDLDIETCLFWGQNAAKQIIMQRGCTIPNYPAKDVFQTDCQS